MKKLTRIEWEALETKEAVKDEKIEEYCEEVLGKTKPIKERLNTVRSIIK